MSPPQHTLLIDMPSFDSLKDQVNTIKSLLAYAHETEHTDRITIVDENEELEHLVIATRDKALATSLIEVLQTHEESADEGTPASEAVLEATGFDSMAEYLRLDTERWQFVAATEERGGSFVRALGKAARLADGENLKRIKQTWPDYWQKCTEESNHEHDTDA